MPPSLTSPSNYEGPTSEHKSLPCVLFTLQSDLYQWPSRAPSHNRFVRQDGSKSVWSCLHQLHTFERTLDFRALTTSMRSSPSDDWSIRQDGSKCLKSSLHLLHTFKLILNFRAATTRTWKAPSNNKSISICQNCSKSTGSSVNFLHTCKLILGRRAVSSTSWVTPSQNWSIIQDRSKCARSCMKPAFTPLSWSWISELSPSLRQQRQHPKSQLIHPPGWQQMRRKFLAPAGDLWADVGLQSCLRNVFFGTPSNDWLVCQDCGECAGSCLNLLHTLQLILHLKVAATIDWMAPCDNSVTSTAPQCKKRLVLPLSLLPARQWLSGGLPPELLQLAETLQDQANALQQQPSRSPVEIISVPESSGPLLWRTLEAKVSRCDHSAELRWPEASNQTVKAMSSLCLFHMSWAKHCQTARAALCPSWIHQDLAQNIETEMQWKSVPPSCFRCCPHQ